MLNQLYIALACVFSFIQCLASAQRIDDDTLKIKSEKVKKGWNFGALPALAFDSDLGFQYGIIGKLINYGDGKVYPRYRHSFYLEWSRTTNGNGENKLSYDSEFLIPKIRVTAEAYYLTDQALNFYGYNGFNALYNKGFENENSSEYITRMFYRMSRKMARLNLDFQGNVSGRNVRWLAGLTLFNTKVDRVNFNRLNEGKSGNDILNDTVTLYDKYVEWGLIPDAQKNGGSSNILKAGIVFDTRDNEPNPMKGIWSEVLLLSAPSFAGNDMPFSRISVTHRQYFTLKKEIINLACRLSYQGKISGEMPFYMLPFIYNSSVIREGLGGSKTLRGILRNRIVGDDIFYGNIELRWKLWRFFKFNQNFYLAVAGFTDFGMVTKNYDAPATKDQAYQYLSNSPDHLHQSYGMGLYGAMNQNFIAALNYGLSADPRDGNNGVYIGLDFLF